ncbi:transposase [Methylobacterium terricola]|uniref:Transposase n=1 Tax=Methylobacterium terricola TaxID=2583531 RepID=A0A5C4L5A6_9HYPH|nr:transposase [Methylobacterium terricola]
MNKNWLLSLADIRGKIEGWRQWCNEGRPHSTCWQRSVASIVSPV